MSNSPRYWFRYDPHADDPYDKGLILRDRGRWRSLETLEYLIDHGFDEVPDEIVHELKNLCLHLPPKRDKGDVSVRPTKLGRVGGAHDALLARHDTGLSSSAPFITEHPPPSEGCGPRELPETRALALRDRLFAGLSTLHQSSNADNARAHDGRDSGDCLQDRAPELLSSLHDKTGPSENSAAAFAPADNECDVPMITSEALLPLTPDLRAAVLRTTEARRLLNGRLQ